MRILLAVALSVCFLVLHSVPVYGGYAIHKGAFVVKSASTLLSPGTRYVRTNYLYNDEEDIKKVPKRFHREDGWRGVTALLLGIVAVFSLRYSYVALLPAILAIVMGGVGLRSFRRNKLLALIGVLLGVYSVYALTMLFLTV